MLRRMNCDRSRLMGVSCCLMGVFAFAFEFDYLVRRFEEVVSDDDFCRYR